MAAASVLGTDAERRAGSNPAPGTVVLEYACDADGCAECTVWLSEPWPYGWGRVVTHDDRWNPTRCGTRWYCPRHAELAGARQYVSLEVREVRGFLEGAVLRPFV